MEVIPLDHQNRSKFTASPSFLQHNRPPRVPLGNRALTQATDEAGASGAEAMSTW